MIALLILLGLAMGGRGRTGAAVNVAGRKVQPKAGTHGAAAAGPKAGDPAQTMVGTVLQREAGDSLVACPTPEGVRWGSTHVGDPCCEGAEGKTAGAGMFETTCKFDGFTNRHTWTRD